MGMAPFGHPNYIEQVLRLIRFHADGSFELDLSYLSFHYSTTRTYSEKFERLFGEPRRPGTDFDTANAGSRRYADIAASIQAVLEEAVLRLARRARELTGSTRAVSGRRCCSEQCRQRQAAARGRL